MIGEPLVTDWVAHICCVLSAVHFYDQASLAAGEINDIRADRFLTHEFRALDGPRAQTVP